MGGSTAAGAISGSNTTGKSGKEYRDDNGQVYRIGNDLAANATYVLNGYTYETDAQGRIASVEGALQIKDRKGRLRIKDSLNDIGKGDELPGDDRGHLIGDRFNGSNGLGNMIPQNAVINRVDFRKLENELAKQVKDKRTVNVKIEPMYGGNSRRPDAIVVAYNIDGEENIRIFPNSKE